MSAFLPSGRHHAHSLSHRDCALVKPHRSPVTALRYLALNGTGPPQPQRTGQHDPPTHHLANDHVVTKLMNRGVHVELCAAMAKVHGYGNEDVIPGIKVNTDAMARTTQLVQQGYVKMTEE